MRLIVICASVLAVLASGCFVLWCDVSGCEEAARPVTNATIDEGIAGVFAYSSDDCSNGCCGCAHSAGRLRVITTGELVTTKERAEELLAAHENDFTIDIDGTYERELAPGTYLGCSTTNGIGACAPFVVEDGRVTSVHVQTTFGPVRITVFRPDGSEGDASFVVGL